MELPRLREWRERRGYTQQGLAEASGVSVRSIAGYEAGRNARPNTAHKMALILDISPEDMMNLEGYKNAPKTTPESSFVRWVLTAPEQGGPDQAEFERLVEEAPDAALQAIETLLRRLLEQPKEQSRKFGGIVWGHNDLVRDRWMATAELLDRRKPPPQAIITTRAGQEAREIRWLIPEADRPAVRERLNEKFGKDGYVEIADSETERVELLEHA